MDLVRIPRIDNNTTPGFCFDDCIATICRYFGLSYEYTYYGALKNRMDYEKSNVSIGEKIIFETEFLDNVRDCYGISLKLHVYKAEEIIEEIKKNIIDGKPVLVCVTGFFCPWDWRYHEIHNGSHTMFVTGFDDDKEVLICDDPYYFVNSGYFSYQEFLLGYIEHFIVEKSEHVKFRSDERLLENLRIALSDSYIVSMKKMPNEILCNFDIEKDIKNYIGNESVVSEEIQDNIAINRAIKDIVHNRVRFALLISYISSVCDEYVGLIGFHEEFIILAKKWNSARLMFLKRIFSNRIERIAEDFSRKLEQIIEEEESLIKETIDLLVKADTNAHSEPAIDTEVILDDFLCINIDTYCNNTAVGSEISSADFNRENEYFKSESFPSGVLEESGNYKFILPNTYCGSADNIACLGHEIPIPEGTYKSLLILGCSDFDNQIEEITLICNDKTQHKRRIILNECVLDWNADIPENAIIKTQKTVVRGNRVVDTETAYVYCIKISLPNAPVVSVVLPDCDSMHIFAMSLGA